MTKTEKVEFQSSCVFFALFIVYLQKDLCIIYKVKVAEPSRIFFSNIISVWPSCVKSLN